MQPIPNFLPDRTTKNLHFEMEHGTLPNFIPPDEPEVKFDFIPGDLQRLLNAQGLQASSTALSSPTSAPVENVEPAVAVDGEPEPETTQEETGPAAQEAAPDLIAQIPPKETLEDTAAILLAARKEIADALGQTSAPVLAAKEENEQEQADAIRTALNGASPNGISAAPMTNHFPAQAPVSQQAASSGLQTLSEGGLGLIGGLSSLIGSAGRATGQAAHHLANEISKHSAARNDHSTKPEVAPSASSLPKVSTFRLTQAEKLANDYQSALSDFWQSGKLPGVRRSIEERARITGESLPDVMAKMVPGGDLEDLRTEFMEAVNDPDAQKNKGVMDRALKGWINQYGRGCEELTSSPDESPEHDGMMKRFEQMRKKMMEAAEETPKFPGEDHSHAEKLKEAIDRIMERIKEIVRSVIDLTRGQQQNESPQPGA